MVRAYFVFNDTHFMYNGLYAGLARITSLHFHQSFTWHFSYLV